MSCHKVEYSMVVQECIGNHAAGGKSHSRRRNSATSSYRRSAAEPNNQMNLRKRSKRSDGDSASQTLVLGHRGLRMNSSPSDPVRENTVVSMEKGWQAGATWVEFDVQITSDGVPVLWHDDHVITLVQNLDHSDCPHQDFQISDLNLAEFRQLTSGSAVEFQGRLHRLGRSFKGGPIMHWTPDQQDPSWQPATLEEALTQAPAGLGFDIELKFMDHRRSTPLERERLLTATLATMEEHCGVREVFFSSFDPDACLEMQQLQSAWPIFMLTAMEDNHQDPRRRTLRAAIQVAISNDLDGVVASNEKLFDEADQIPTLMDAGLKLFTYGAANCNAGLIAKQISAGVTGLCTDNVALCVDAISQHESVTAESLLQAAHEKGDVVISPVINEILPQSAVIAVKA